ncbi:MAG: cell wall hydrolase [Defluviitaleaceae bacterium]|nr:cell wall hydrolase [Defluviitaleaceae bacterium]
MICNIKFITILLIIFSIRLGGSMYVQENIETYKMEYKTELMKETKPEKEEYFKEAKPTIAENFTIQELDILYRIVWAEARGEDKKGLILVVNVIINRLNSPLFPNTIEEVVFQYRQFSPILDGSFNRATPDSRIKNAVHMALAGEDHSEGALFFRTIRGAENSWHERSLTKLFDHGNHRFYKPPTWGL